MIDTSRVGLSLRGQENSMQCSNHGAAQELTAPPRARGRPQSLLFDEEETAV